jgi:two-component system response regulator CpxR
MNKILVVEDDVELCGMLREFFRPEGFQVDTVHDGERGLSKAAGGDYDLVILDVMLPRLSGLEVLKRLRAETKKPVLLLTARGEDVDRILGLELGADDYLPKPFNPRELLARVRAILRRSGDPERDPRPRPERIVVDDLAMDTGTRSVVLAGHDVELTSVEFNILEVLLRNAGRIVSREDLARQALGREFSPFDRSIDMHVSKLRRKLAESVAGRDYIKTVRSAGYMYAQAASVDSVR